MTTLLDGNLLVALLVDDHVHHASAERWWATRDAPTFATTPITQGTLLRFLLRHGVGAADSMVVLLQLTSTGDHTFWNDGFAYEASFLRGVIGHRQVTDAYLAEQARRRKGRLATFDAGLASSHADVADLVAVIGTPAAP